MRRYLCLTGWILVAGIVGVAAVGIAQRPPGPPHGPPPVIAALDVDRDGTISAEEIKNAPAALLTLDKNKDGMLTEDELRPPRRPDSEERGEGPPRPEQGERPPRPERGGPEGRDADRPQRPEAGASPHRSSGKTAPLGTLVFSGGYVTDPKDHGRPVSLVAGALGVSDEVFREAFSRVRPAHAGTQPDPEQVRKNKSVLMEALGKHGISNERLDTVSNYYRYVQSRGELWPTTPASGYAKIEDGKVIGFVITDGGSGYNSPPTVRVEGMPNVVVQAKLGFSKEFKANGAVTEVTMTKAKAD